MWRGIRFRTPTDDHDHQSVTWEVAKVANPLGTSPYEGGLGKVLEPSATSGTKIKSSVISGSCEDQQLSLSTLDPVPYAWCPRFSCSPTQHTEACAGFYRQAATVDPGTCEHCMPGCRSGAHLPLCVSSRVMALDAEREPE